MCAEKLRDMEVQVNTARREHTKAGTLHINVNNSMVYACDTTAHTHTLCFVSLCAVVALRQVQRQAEREREQMKDAERERAEHTNMQITQLRKQLKHKDKDRNLLLVSETNTHTRILARVDAQFSAVHYFVCSCRLWFRNRV